MTKDYSAVTKVTLKNTNPAEDLTVTPAVVAVPVSFRYFGVNFEEVLAPQDEVVLAPATSEIAAYYDSLNDATIGLEVTVE